MFRLIVLLIAVLTPYGLAASVDQCVFGESYWCSSLENAKTCGALAHCKSTVWQKESLKQDESEICFFCETILKDVENFIKENATEQRIMNFLINACQMIPAKSLADECRAIVQTYLPEIIDLLTSGVSPRAVCTLLKLCDGFEDKVSHPQLPVSLVKPKLIKKLSPLPINSEPICTDCVKFFTDIKNLISANATEEEIEQLIDQTLCAILGSYEEMCKQLVKEFLPEIVQMLTTEFDPKVLCKQFGFCSSSMSEARTFLLNLKLKKSDFFPTGSAANSAEECAVCKTVLKELQDLDRDKAIQTEIKNFLKKEVCEHLGNYKASCIGLIDVYGSVLFELLANELDPESRCRSLGFCAAGNVIPGLGLGFTPVTDANDGKPLCGVCTFVFQQLVNVLSKPETKDFIINTLGKLCGILPVTLKPQCDLLINQFGRLVYDQLILMLHPDTLCKTLKLCSMPERVVLPKVQGGLECTICETVVQYLEALLAENATIAAIEEMLGKICNFLPSELKPECDAVVNKYGPFIIQFLTTELTPRVICEKAGACSESANLKFVAETKEVKSSQKLLGENECTWGPKYWCASKENAARCQAIDFCEQTGWDF